MSERIKPKEFVPGGWMVCSGPCNDQVLLRGQLYVKALKVLGQGKKIICDTCDPVNGLITDGRSDGKQIISPTDYGELS